MALKVWLPLINKINNQGTFLNNPTNTGATVSTAGPLGGSYSFNGTSHKIQTIYPSAEASMTVCLWATFTKLNVHLLDMRNQSGVGYQPFFVGTSGVQVGGSNGSYPYISFVPSINTWYHLAVVYSQNDTKLYVNGEYYGGSSSSVGYNFNMNLEVHIGSRWSNANWFGGNIADFRIYNEALSAYEIRKISQGLLLHYTRPLSSTIYAGDSLCDSSGYNRDSTLYTANWTLTTNADKKFWLWNTGSSGGYSSITSPSSSTKTISFWLRTPKTVSTVFFADYKSKMAFGFNGSGYIIATCDTWNKPMFTNTSALVANTNSHIVIRHNSSDDGIELFINGVQQTASGSNNYWTHSSDTLMIGRRSTGTPMYNTGFRDFRMYCTRLSDNDILDLYHVGLKQLNNGKSSPFELCEETLGKVKVYGTGVIANDSFVESTVGNKFKSTQVISDEFIER